MGVWQEVLGHRDHNVDLVIFDDMFEVSIDVSGRDDEPARLGADAAIALDRNRERLSAVEARAFADETRLQVNPEKLLVQVADPLIDVRKSAWLETRFESIRLTGTADPSKLRVVLRGRV
jgi:hypothetical protein